MAKRIEEPKQGLPVNQYGPIIREAAKGLNAWNAAEVKFENTGGDTPTGKFQFSDSNVVLILKDIAAGKKLTYYVVLNGALYTQEFLVSKDPEPVI